MKATCGHPLYWHNCYVSGFDLIAPESYAHPAKMAGRLCFRILEHLKELGLLKDSDTVLDPMAGTGITNICAGALGYKSVSVELEEKFIGFEKQNKDYASRRLYKELDWTILQGDARKLSELLSERGLVTVSSPPFANSEGQKLPHKFKNPAEFASRASERLATGKIKGHYASPEAILRNMEKIGDYGTTPGQIGNMRDKPLKAVMSPPYSETLQGCGADSIRKRIAEGKYTGKRPDVWTSQGNKAGSTYGDSYSKDPENIGNQKNETYLSAMLQVYQEIGKVSDCLSIVIKNPTRAGNLRRLDLDTIKLLEMSGWTIHCQHRALLFEEVEQLTLEGNTHKKVKGRMSFFKRLSWQNGQPVSSWEDVIIAVRQS